MNRNFIKQLSVSIVTVKKLNFQILMSIRILGLRTGLDYDILGPGAVLVSGPLYTGTKLYWILYIKKKNTRTHILYYVLILLFRYHCHKGEFNIIPIYL